MSPQPRTARQPSAFHLSERAGLWALAVSALGLVVVVSPELMVAAGQSVLVRSESYVASFVLGIAAAAIACVARATRPFGAMAAVLWFALLCPWIVLGIYAIGMSLPSDVQTLAFLWPAWVLFGSTLFHVSPEQPVLPMQWAGIVTLGFWSIVAVALALAMPRRRSIAASIGVAAFVVMAIAWLVRIVVPAFGWKSVLS